MDRNERIQSARRVALALALVWAAGLGACNSPPNPPGGNPQSVAIITTVAGTGVASFTGDGRPALESGLYAPQQITFDADGAPLILDWNNQRVRKLAPDGTLMTVLGTGFEAISDIGGLAIGFPLHHCFDVTFVDGQLYFAGYHDPRVLRVDASQHVQLVCGSENSGDSGDNGPVDQAELTYPAGVAIAPDGTVFVVAQLNNSIRRADPDGIIRRVAGTGAQGYSGDGGPAVDAELNNPTRIQRDADGNLYFCDTMNHVIRRIALDGTISTVAGTGQRGYAGDGGRAIDAQLDQPFDLLILPDRTLLIADSLNHAIRHVDSQGSIRTIAGNGAAGFTGDGGPVRDAQFNVPSGLALDAAGNLWIADTYNHRVRRVTPGFLLTGE